MRIKTRDLELPRKIGRKTASVLPALRIMRWDPAKTLRAV
jgi:hypothetical protein